MYHKRRGYKPKGDINQSPEVSNKCASVTQQNSRILVQHKELRLRPAKQNVENRRFEL